jgi:MFS family permease
VADAGPASDRYGRKPVVVFACTLFVFAGIGCAFARSLLTFLTWRVALMTALMAACSLLGLVSYLLIARPAKRVVIPPERALAKLSHIATVIASCCHEAEA